VHNSLQVFVTVTEQDTSLTLGKKIARDNVITTFKLFNLKKKIAAMTNFQFVNANQLGAKLA